MAGIERRDIGSKLVGRHLVGQIGGEAGIRREVNLRHLVLRATRIESGRQDIFQMYIDRYKDNYPDIIAGFPPIEEFSKGGALFELVGR